MQNVGQKILNYLERKQINLKDLALRIDLEPEFLRNELELGTLKIKTLEKLSKELRIPLYSFFSTIPSDITDTKKFFEIPYYIERLEPIEKDELSNLLSALNSEIFALKQALAEKDQEILNLRAMLNQTNKNL